MCSPRQQTRPISAKICCMWPPAGGHSPTRGWLSGWEGPALGRTRPRFVWQRRWGKTDSISLESCPQPLRGHRYHARVRLTSLNGSGQQPSPVLHRLHLLGPAAGALIYTPEANRLLEGRRLVSLELDRVTADLRLYFDGETRLDVFNYSSATEGWDVDGTSRHQRLFQQHEQTAPDCG